ncbi:MAG: hypothetical protein HUU38_27430 [Anaerolineales bacterium]|nr:hypothetical protein [Anaerolineales bacterium]
MQIPQFLHPPRTTLRNPWFRYAIPVLMGMMIAAFVSLWPDIQCRVFAQCSARDLWCNGDCSQVCQPATSVGYVASCSPVIIPGGSYCDDDFRSDVCAVRCTDPNNCNVTQQVTGGACSGRLRQQGGYSTWNVGRCPSYAADPSCKVQTRYTRVDCCGGSSGGGGGGGGGGCEPEYAPPAIALSEYTPPYPIVIGQDPDEIGVDIVLTATGGNKTNGCDGDDQASITGLSIVQVKLSDATVTWITGYLAQRFPGADILDSYPFVPAFTTSLNGSTATLNAHLDPLDPGWYEVQAQATQDDGQSITATVQIPVYLLDSTITLP